MWEGGELQKKKNADHSDRLKTVGGKRAVQREGPLNRLGAGGEQVYGTLMRLKKRPKKSDEKGDSLLNEMLVVEK